MHDDGTEVFRRALAYWIRSLAHSLRLSEFLVGNAHPDEALPNSRVIAVPSSDSYRPPGYPGLLSDDSAANQLVQITVPPQFVLRVRPSEHWLRASL